MPRNSHVTSKDNILPCYENVFREVLGLSSLASCGILSLVTWRSYDGRICTACLGLVSWCLSSSWSWCLSTTCTLIATVISLSLNKESLFLNSGTRWVINNYDGRRILSTKSELSLVCINSLICYYWCLVLLRLIASSSLVSTGWNCFIRLGGLIFCCILSLVLSFSLITGGWLGLISNIAASISFSRSIREVLDPQVFAILDYNPVISDFETLELYLAQKIFQHLQPYYAQINSLGSCWGISLSCLPASRFVCLSFISFRWGILLRDLLLIWVSLKYSPSSCSWGRWIRYIYGTSWGVLCRNINFGTSWCILCRNIDCDRSLIH